MSAESTNLPDGGQYYSPKFGKTILTKDNYTWENFREDFTESYLLLNQQLREGLVNFRKNAYYAMARPEVYEFVVCAVALTLLYFGIRLGIEEGSRTKPMY